MPDLVKPWRENYFGYDYKDAWYAFCHHVDHDLGTAIVRVMAAMPEDDKLSDEILSSGLWVEAKYLRIAWLLGLVEFDWEAAG